MSIEGILLSAVIFLIGILWLASPFVMKNISQAQVTRQQDRQSLLNAYERLLSRLRDLDEDYNLGKMPQADYEIERKQLAERGATLLAQIETTLGGVKSAPKPPTGDADAVLDSAIEQAIANYVAANTQEEQEHATTR
jgi:Tfp pilus assembly protein PilV